LFGGLNLEDQRNPKLLLVRAYSTYLLNDYFTALGHIARASLQLDELTGEVRCLANFGQSSGLIELG
jgi:hypothetical protein